MYQVTDHPTRVPSGQVTEDGRYLVIGLFDGYESNAVLVQDLRKPAAKPQPLFTAWDALYNFIGSKGDELYFQTTNDAPRGRVIAVDARRPGARAAGAPSCRTATSRSPTPAYIGGRVVVEYSRDARSVVRLFEVNGAQAGEVKLPGLGTATGFPGHAARTRKRSSPTRTIYRRRASCASTSRRTP